MSVKLRSAAFIKLPKSLAYSRETVSSFSSDVSQTGIRPRSGKDWHMGRAKPFVNCSSRSESHQWPALEPCLPRSSESRALSSRGTGRPEISPRYKREQRSVEDAVLTTAGDKIAGATGTAVKLRAERKLGGRLEALTPQRLRSVFNRCGGARRAEVTQFAGHSSAKLRRHGPLESERPQAPTARVRSRRPSSQPGRRG